MWVKNSDPNPKLAGHERFNSLELPSLMMWHLPRSNSISIVQLTCLMGLQKNFHRTSG